MQPQDASHITLRRVWSDYQTVRILRPTTHRNYVLRIEINLAEWLDTPLAEITRPMVLLKFGEIGKRGEAMTNSTFRTFKAVYNFALAYYEAPDGSPLLKCGNPVVKLSQVKAWHPDRKRRNCFMLELGPWLRAVMGLNNSLMRDYFLVLLFTGMRKNEALKLEWQQVCVKTGVIRLSANDTKTKAPREIPMSDFLWKVLAQRQYIAHPLEKYVFPGKNGSHWQEVTNAVNEVRQRSGVSWSCHAARRTYASCADEAEVRREVVAQLLGHKGTITDDYTIRSLPRLRRAQQAISDCILQMAKQERQAPEASQYALTNV